MSEVATPKYVRPKELAERWAVSRSSVDRIALRAGLTRVVLGVGRNGTIRYLWQEVLTYEKAQQQTYSIR